MIVPLSTAAVRGSSGRSAVGAQDETSHASSKATVLKSEWIVWSGSEVSLFHFQLQLSEGVLGAVPRDPTQARMKLHMPRVRPLV